MLRIAGITPVRTQHAVTPIATTLHNVSRMMRSAIHIKAAADRTHISTHAVASSTIESTPTVTATAVVTSKAKMSSDSPSSIQMHPSIAPKQPARHFHASATPPLNSPAIAGLTYVTSYAITETTTSTADTVGPALSLQFQDHEHPSHVPRYVKKPVSVDANFKEQRVHQSWITPNGEPVHPVIGRKASINIDGSSRTAKVLGFDYRERPIVHLHGDQPGETRIITDPKTAQVFIPSAKEYRSCISTMVHGKVYKPTQEFIERMTHALTRPIVGNKCAMDYIFWLHNNGVEAFVLGGAIRDLVRESLKATLSDEEVVKIMNDIDLSVVAGAPTALKMFQALHNDDPLLDVVHFEQYGVAHGKAAGQGNGLDVNGMMIGNHTYDPPRVHRDVPHEGAVVPALFGGAPERLTMAIDFRCNSLLYDPINQVVVDPTGHGMDDAAHSMLRLTGGEKLEHALHETLISKQPELIQRFYKFRMRNYHSNTFTTNLCQSIAAERWAKVAPIKICNDVMRMLPVNKLHGSTAEKKLQLNQMLDHLTHLMNEDDFVSGHHYHLAQTLEKYREKIVHYILHHKAPKS